MKIAVVSESPADEAALKILVQAILGSEAEVVSTRLRSRGWPSVLHLLPSIIKHLHYQTNDIEAFVVVVDSDDSEVHRSEHENREILVNTDCRLCQLRRTALYEIQRLKPIPNRIAMKYAVGVAVPAIEAWYQCGLDAHVSEATWSRSLRAESITYSKRSLKLATYGSDRPNLEMETEAAEESARRFVADLSLLEQHFPNGFGSLLRDLLGWKKEV